MAAVIFEGAREPVIQADTRRPAGQLAEPAVVGDEVADVDAFALLREFAMLELAGAIRPDQRLGEPSPAVSRLSAAIRNASAASST
jgi:hypothetical protein